VQGEFLASFLGGLTPAIVKHCHLRSATLVSLASMISPAEHCVCPFLFERDSFSFANELLWQYRFDPVTGAMSTFRTAPAPAYAHRCFVMVRSARQFFYHAHFDPELPGATAHTYRRLIREVVSRNPRGTGAGQPRVAIPGYDCLRSFSREHEPLLKAECGSAWESYVVRSHWRMVFPIWRPAPGTYGTANSSKRCETGLCRSFTSSASPNLD